MTEDPGQLGPALDDLYREVVESSTDGIWILDLEGNTIYANRALIQLHGRRPASAYEPLDEPGRKMFRAHLAATNRGDFNASEVECLFHHVDGSSTWVLVAETPLYDDNGTLRASLQRVIDYTERRRVRDELERSRQELEVAQDLAQMGSWEWDLRSDVLLASHGLVQRFGSPPRIEHPGSSLLVTQTHPDDRELVESSIAAALAGADSFVFDARLWRRDQWRWTRGRGAVRRDVAGEPVAISGSLQDITDLKTVEAALHDQISQVAFMQTIASAANQASTLREVLAQAGDLVLLHDEWSRARGFEPDEQGFLRPLYVNDDASDAETRAADLEYPERAAADLALAARAVEARGPVWSEDRLTISFPVFAADAVCACINLTSDSPLSRHNMIEAMAKTIAAQLATVAERESARESLADARDAAMDASRQKSAFLATMSHEIRTPLNGVIGLIDLLLRTDLDRSQRRLASGVHVASRALLGVINDVLDFSKVEAGRLVLEEVEFEVRPVFDQVAELLAESARTKGLDLIVACHPEIPEKLSGDPVRLGQVLTNLVANAVKFTESGEVFVHATAEHPDADGSITLRVEVQDTGIGIDPDIVEGLFSPFTQADASTTRRYGGTGLGLAISRAIVEGLGGDLVHATNPVPVGGSIFSFTAEFQAVTDAAVDPADIYARSHLAGRRMLTVNDTVHHRLILEEQLDWLQVRYESADSAADAIQRLREAAENDDPFDATLLDLTTNQAAGSDLASEIRSHPELAEVAVVMLTLLDDSEMAAVGMRDIDAHLSKPVLFGALRDLLLEHVAEAPPQPDAHAGYPQQDRRLRLLVVEDNEINQMVATGILEAMGHQVDIAQTGLEAVEKMPVGHYDVVLMDVQMPVMDGYAATQAIRTREADGEHTPIIATTAAAVEGERERCLAAGMDGFLTKPIDPQLLAESLEAVSGVTVLTPVAGQTQPVTTPLPGLDVARVAMLRDLDPDGAYFTRAVANFTVRSRESVGSLRAHLGDGDVTSVRTVAHQLAGSALNLGARRVGAVARDIEVIVDTTGELAGIDELVEELDALCEQARTSLGEYLKVGDV